MAGFPPSISLPGPGGAGAPGGGGLAGLLGGGGGGGQEEPEPADDSAEELVKKAQKLIEQALPLETEPEDKLELHQIAADMQKYLAGEQKLKDTAMGAGPGAKMIRKASNAGGGY